MLKIDKNHRFLLNVVCQQAILNHFTSRLDKVMNKFPLCLFIISRLVRNKNKRKIPEKNLRNICSTVSKLFVKASMIMLKAVFLDLPTI